MTARSRVLLMLVCACSVLSVGMTAARSQETAPSAPPSIPAAPTVDKSTTPEKSSVAPDTPAATPQASEKSQPKFETPAVLVDDKHLESILGREIHTSTGETLGNVTDILVDDGGKVRAAIVDFGGFLGVGVRKLAIAWSAIQFVPSKSSPNAILNMDKDQLRVAPEYHAGEPIVILGADAKPSQSAPQGQ